MATLGGQPQVVTFTLDLLKAQGEKINQVALFYLAQNSRYKKSFRILAQEFSGDSYLGESCHLRSVPIRVDEQNLASLRTPSEINALHQTISELFYQLKKQGYRIHLSLSGGRRAMAILATSIAMQHFDSADRIWHIHTSEQIRQEANGGKLLHIPHNEGIELIKIPFLSWTNYFPGMKKLMGYETAARVDFGLLDSHDRDLCTQVWNSLTLRQKDALRAITETASRQEAAEKLNISPSTLDSHKTKIIRTCKELWLDEKTDIHFLRRKFTPFLA